MIITENYKDNLIRTYSSIGNYIERDGVLYGEAIDIAAFGYVYTETDIPIEIEEATEADYLQALNMLGVSEND